MDEKPVTTQALEQVNRAADEMAEWFMEWGRRAEEQLTDWYLVFEDFGLVEPYYDPVSTCSSIEEEWELFQ